MAPPRKLSPQSVWDTPAVLQAFQEEGGIKPMHAQRMWGYLIRHPEASWHDVPDMPKAAVALLDRYFTKFTTRVVQCQTSSDCSTTKLLVELQDGMRVEAVVMTYESPSRDPQLLAAAAEDDPRLPVEYRDDEEEGEGEGAEGGEQQQQKQQRRRRQQQRYQRRQQQQAAAGLVSDNQPQQDQQAEEGAEARGAGAEEGACCGGGCGRAAAAPAASPAAAAASTASPAPLDDDDDDDASSDYASASGSPAPSVCEPGRGGGGGGGGGRASAGAAAARLRKRSTLCVSSQVGCQMGCTFCATGTMGLKGNLTAGEIIEQLVHARAVTGIRNIVFMGMGEPLNNYEPVRAAVAMMTDSKGFGLRRRHVTVSTVGVIPRIKQLAEDLPGVSLALSLHAPTQELRATIVPSAKAYKLPALMAAVRAYQASSSQRVFYEYVMLSGVNDGEQQAHELGQLLQGDDVVVNLIPWNPIYQPEGPFFNAPVGGSVAAFQSVLRNTYGLHTTVRQEMGQDISGACGQLVIEAGGGGGGGGCSREATRDIEDAVRKVGLGPVA